MTPWGNIVTLVTGRDEIFTYKELLQINKKDHQLVRTRGKEKHRQFIGKSVARVHMLNSLHL